MLAGVIIGGPGVPELVLTASVCTPVRCLGCRILNIACEHEKAEKKNPNLPLLLVCRAAGLIGRPLNGVLQAHLCPSIQPAPHRGRYGIAAPRRCLPERVCPMCARERVLDTCDCPDAVTCDQFVAIAQRQSCSGNQLWQSVAIIIRDNH
jgi:hypothetical protein